MYYRLLAPQLLPQLLPRQLHRVLYLDPDVLILNSLLPLWQMDLEGKLFAAASHKGKAELASGLNQVGLAAEGKQGAPASPQTLYCSSTSRSIGLTDTSRRWCCISSVR